MLLFSFRFKGFILELGENAIWCHYVGLRRMFEPRPKQTSVVLRKICVFTPPQELRQFNLLGPRTRTIKIKTVSFDEAETVFFNSMAIIYLLIISYLNPDMYIYIYRIYVYRQYILKFSSWYMNILWSYIALNNTSYYFLMNWQSHRDHVFKDFFLVRAWSGGSSPNGVLKFWCVLFMVGLLISGRWYINTYHMT